MMAKGKAGRVRIILAIAFKDIQDALRNRILLSIIIGVLLVMVQGKALPLLFKLTDVVQVAVHNEDESPIVQDLRSNREFRVIEASSSDELRQILAEASGRILGIETPEGYGSDPNQTSILRIEGYYAYWMRPEEIANLEAQLERHLASVTGLEVMLDTEAVYAQPDSGGQAFMSALVMVLMTTLICMIVVPYQMIEEKEAHTMQSLLVSPARIGDVVLGKALAGLVYGLVAGAVVLAFYQAQIVHWWIAVVTCICGSVFAVALGLLLGSLFENIPTMNLWMAILMVVLVAPLIAVRYIPADWPAIVTSVLPWIPTVPLYNTYVLSFTESPSILHVGINLGVVLGSAAVLLAIVAGIVRRSDR
jgi:ABC-type Na+ efflux pump permease subunit